MKTKSKFSSSLLLLLPCTRNSLPQFSRLNVAVLGKITRFMLLETNLSVDILVRDLYKMQSVTITAP